MGLEDQLAISAGPPLFSPTARLIPHEHLEPSVFPELPHPIYLLKFGGQLLEVYSTMEPHVASEPHIGHRSQSCAEHRVEEAIPGPGPR